MSRAAVRGVCVVVGAVVGVVLGLVCGALVMGLYILCGVGARFLAFVNLFWSRLRISFVTDL